MDYRLPGSSVHGIFQAKILVWVAIWASEFLDSFFLYYYMENNSFPSRFLLVGVLSRQFLKQGSFLIRVVEFLKVSMGRVFPRNPRVDLGLLCCCSLLDG